MKKEAMYSGIYGGGYIYYGTERTPVTQKGNVQQVLAPNLDLDQYPSRPLYYRFQEQSKSFPGTEQKVMHINHGIEVQSIHVKDIPRIPNQNVRGSENH